MSTSQSTPVSLPVPHPVSGVVDCAADLSFADFVKAVEQAGWSVDGIQPEPGELTVAEVLERRQPRPSHWGSGLLVDRCCRLSAGRDSGHEYASIRAPRKASGPDLAFLFFGAEGAMGSIERASFSLVKPATSYLSASGQLESMDELFAAARAVSLLDPLSTRRLVWAEKELSAWVPVRSQSHEPIRRYLRDLGLDAKLAMSVPTAQRFVSVVTGMPRLEVSASYAVIAALVAQADAERGRKRIDVDVRYLDSHGAQVILGASKAGFTLLESLYSTVLDAGEYDDVTLIELDGEQRSPAANALPNATEGGS